ncbi:hypothetical protein [Paraburkholderia caledonica]
MNQTSMPRKFAGDEHGTFAGIGSTGALRAIRMMPERIKRRAVFELWDDQLPVGLAEMLGSNYCIAVPLPPDKTDGDSPLPAKVPKFSFRCAGGPDERIHVILGDGALALDLDTLQMNILAMDHLSVLFLREHSWLAARCAVDEVERSAILRAILMPPAVPPEQSRSQKRQAVDALTVRYGRRLDVQ